MPIATSKHNLFAKLMFFYRALQLLVALAAIVLANASYEYVDTTASALLEDVIEVDSQIDQAPVYSAAGWPVRFYVQIRYHDAGQYTHLDIKALAKNVTVWGGVVFLCIAYWKWGAWQNRKRSESSRRVLGLKDLFALTFLVALPFMYWKIIGQALEINSNLVSEISVVGGRTSQELVVPKWYAKYMPEWALESQKRLTGVNLVDPSDDLVRRVVALPHLKVLKIDGGQYDLRLLDRLKANPLLYELRIAGRALDDEFVSSLAGFHQLERLNLMRTNVETNGVRNLGFLANLKRLNLVHTDFKLKENEEEIDCFSSLHELWLPHPEVGVSEAFFLQGVPLLKRVWCIEFDELKNRSPVTLDVADCPKLESIFLDSLQLFDLKLKNLPMLSAIEVKSHQRSTRITDAQSAPDVPWVKNVQLSSLPSLKKLSIFVSDLNSVEIDEGMSLDLECSVSYSATRQGSWILVQARITNEFATREHSQHWLNALSKGDGISSLSLRYFPLQGVDLSPILQLKSLKTLDLSVTDLSRMQLESLSNMKQLERLYLNDCIVDGRAVQKIVASMPSLKELRVNPNTLATLRLEGRPQLEKIFANVVLPSFEISALRLVDMPNLNEELDLSSALSYLHLDQVQSLRGLSISASLPPKTTIRGLRDLKYFAAGGINVNDAILEEVLQCKCLEKLTLAYSSISSEMLERISELPNLTHLRLPGCKVNDQVVQKLKELKNLKELFLDDTEVTDQGISQLELSNFSRLSFRRTKTSSDLLKTICQPNRKTPLAWLGLGGFELTEADLRLIAGLGTIEVLCLSDLSLDSKKIAALSMDSMPGLFWLQLQRVESDAKNLLKLCKSSRARMDLVDCNNDYLALNVLAQEDRLSRESALESGDFQQRTASEIAAGFRIMDLAGSSNMGFQRRIVYVFPKGEIFCDRFIPTRKLNK